MIRHAAFSVILMCFFCTGLPELFPQQIDVGRIEMMPNMPQPYEMRDWKAVARQYDSLAFDLQNTGQYLPLSTIIQNTVNYPEHPSFGLQSYVGTNSPPGRESINLIPAVIGATLVGIDKGNQFGYNWVLMCEEYFNNRPEENVYLNTPVASSGQDWWYETMPNVFFYQLNYFYPGTGHFDYQFVTVADRWLEAVKSMGGNDAPWTGAYMDYRAFALSTMTPLTSGVHEPEAAGAIAWLLYQAYQVTGDTKYRKGAEWSMEFLDGLTTNPSYELQLSYGAYVAARMNAELGTDYDLEKIVNWCFDIGPLRQWGAVVESWGGIDVQGLIGEARENFSGYVFNMNSLEQAGALVPMVRYDDRFARAIGKWVLNAANASRLYYSAFLPDNMQDNESWAKEFDLYSTIAYEALREQPAGPYGTGDAMNGGWAETNLGLYGSSHVGILGGLIDTTDVPGILRLNLLATDYYHDTAYPSYLLFNPYNTSRTIHVDFSGSPYSVYDAALNQVVIFNVVGNTPMIIPANSAVLAVVIPAGSEIVYDLNKAKVNGIVIDHNAGISVTNYPPRIKSVAASDTTVITGSEFGLFCTATDRETADLSYLWESEGTVIGTSAVITMHAPDIPGTIFYKCTVTDGEGMKAVDSVKVNIVENINYPPEIITLAASDRYMESGDTLFLACHAKDPNNDVLIFSWTAEGGSIQGNDSLATYISSGAEGIYFVTCGVSDPSGATDSKSLSMLLNDPGNDQAGNLVASYEFAGDLTDQSGYGHNGIPFNITYTDDRQGNPGQAVAFPLSTSMVRIANTPVLNFRDGLTFTGWINADNFYDRESYVISHGNWMNRWKISLGHHTLRFTTNGEGGIMDLDLEDSLEVHRWYHIAAIYDGNYCQIYLDGKLNAFKSYQGRINQTVYDMDMGQSLPDQTGFDYKGKLDKVKIFNYGITHDEAVSIYSEEASAIREMSSGNASMLIFPNPAREFATILVDPGITSYDLSVNRLDGTQVFRIRSAKPAHRDSIIQVPVSQLDPGIYLVVISNDHTRITGKLVILR